MGAPTEHARLAPSSAHRWGPDGCAGSMAMQEAHPDPDPDGPEAREGTAAHWTALDVMLATGEVPAIGTLAPNGYPVDRAMLEGGEMLVEAVGDRTGVRIEQRVTPHATIHPSCDGTPDAYLVDRDAKHVHVWDYKYGHKYVQARGNWQGVSYLAGVFEGAGVTRFGLSEWTASFTVVQPRCYHSDGPVRTWRVKGPEMQVLFDRLRQAALAAVNPHATTRTGDHCYKCTAAWDCEAHLRSGQTAIDTVGTQVPLRMGPAALALWKHQVDTAAARLKSISDAVDERILGQLRGGQIVPGYGIGSTSPLERWRNPSAAAQMGDMMGVDLRKPDPALVTPKQARKMGVDSTVIDAYAETPTGTQKLVKTDSDAALAVFGTR